MADGQNRLVQVEGILQQQLVHRGAGRVGLTALGDRIFAISLRVHVESAARQQNPLHPGQQPGHAVLALMQRNNHRRGAGGIEGRQDTAAATADCKPSRCWWAREWRYEHSWQTPV